MIQRERLDPDVLKRLDDIAAINGPRIETLPPAEARQMAADGLSPAIQGTPEPVAHVETRIIPGLGGPLAIRIYTPEGPGPFPAIVYFHGGGWVVCSLNSHDVPCHALARGTPAVVIAVDYRLAPEHPFPAAVDDAYAAVRWVSANAEQLGVDPSRLIVCGDSAGGNLATVAAMRARDEQGPAIATQVLIYPVTNLTSLDTASYEEFADGYHLTKPAMEWFRGHYTPVAESRSDPHASPLLAKDLSGLPPALVITAECDVLRDEGETYAKRLQEAGVPVTLTRYPGLIHPFFSLAGAIRRTSEAYDQVARHCAAAVALELQHQFGR